MNSTTSISELVFCADLGGHKHGTENEEEVELHFVVSKELTYFDMFFRWGKEREDLI